MPDRFAQVVEGLYRGGRPSAEDLAALQDLWGIKKVVSLDEESGKAIEPICRDLGLKQIIWGLGDGTDPKVAALKSKIVPQLLMGGPTYVHCFHGKDRTGMCIAMFRINNGWPLEKALKEAASFGMGTNLDSDVRDSYYNAVKEFSKDADVSDADIVSQMREENSFGIASPAVNNQNIPNSDWSMNFNVPPHADPAVGPLDRVLAYSRVFCKCDSSKLLLPNVRWWETQKQAEANPTDENGRVFSAVLDSSTKLERFDGRVTDSLRAHALTKDIDVAAFRDGSYLVVYPGILVSIQEEDDSNDNVGVEVGMHNNSVDSPLAVPVSGSGVGSAIPAGAAAPVTLPFTGPGQV